MINGYNIGDIVKAISLTDNTLVNGLLIDVVNGYALIQIDQGMIWLHVNCIDSEF